MVMEVKKMTIQEKIEKCYPLTQKINCGLNCYLLDKRKYLVFWNYVVNEDSIPQILDQMEETATKLNQTVTTRSVFSRRKTFLVIAETDEEFKKADLVYFNGVNICVVFYLINKKSNKIFMNDGGIFILGYGYRKYVKKINDILRK